ncbi:hypothetical protein RBH26_19630 [Natronolimnohabitans sp. A-GB9]|uniref:hypothetical protein n=1 Tax=Natronolimnohabitans sp. A-GB9 TaxID=3069757 RepID=UPI0027B2B37D|nr:hypothetical protein [Natronolimnohabitans sp. A-GB9]MDQ2052671.1 hypothetical protein [Natronolimnohabitans sp. A-GB9]
MGVSASIGILSQTIERYEADNGEIHRVDATVRDDTDGPSVSVDVAVPLSTGRSTTDSTPADVTIDDDGGLRLEFPPSVVPAIDEYTPADVSSVQDGATVTADGTVLVTFTLGLEEETERTAAAVTSGEDETSDDDTEASQAGQNTPLESLENAAANDDWESQAEASTNESDDRSAPDSVDEGESTDDAAIDPEIERALATARNEDLPPYDDVEYLQCLYDSFETFTAMAKALEMDVASETVRRYMIDAGIHEPASYDTPTPDDAASDAESESKRTDDVDVDGTTAIDDPAEPTAEKQLVADGIGLPEDVEIGALLDALETSMTLHDVSRQLDLERERARDLLEQLNLIDLVVKRVYASDDPGRRPDRDEIVDRIRESATLE